MPVILEEAHLRQLCPIDHAALAAVEDAFRWHAQGRVAMPPIMHIDVTEGNGEIDVKGACVSGLENLTVKIGTGFFDNPARGLPSLSSIMIVFNATTGTCEAVLLENGYLTNLRTGMAGAIAAKYLARQDITNVGILGAGAQARFQVECLRLVKDFTNVRIWSRNAANAQQCAAELRAKLGLNVIACESPEEVVRASEVLVTTTPSTTAIVQESWLREGTHVTAMGADNRGKQELAAACLRRANLVACDSVQQCMSVGELQHAPDVDIASVVELGQLVSGKVHVDRADRDITICDLTGMGVQDTAIAWFALMRHGAAASG